MFGIELFSFFGIALAYVPKSRWLFLLFLFWSDIPVVKFERTFDYCCVCVIFSFCCRGTNYFSNFHVPQNKCGCTMSKEYYVNVEHVTDPRKHSHKDISVVSERGGSAAEADSFLPSLSKIFGDTVAEENRPLINK